MLENKRLKHIENNWDALAVKHPYFAVITDPTYESGPNYNFWNSGEITAKWICDDLSSIGLNPKELSACELGSGVGRVMFGIHDKVKDVTGFDVSNEMLWISRKRFGSFLSFIKFAGFFPGYYDLVYSIIVLQHNPPAVIIQLLNEMFKSSLKAVWFQLPLPTDNEDEEPPIPCIPMYGLSEDVVEGIGHANGFKLAFKNSNDSAGPTIESRHYLFIK